MINIEEYKDTRMENHTDSLQNLLRPQFPNWPIYILILVVDIIIFFGMEQK